jgi:NADPH:quinone reductase-like Zn-dependent oxidoreductase
MKVIILNGFGSAENFSTIEFPGPLPADNELLIEVKAIGLNPADINTRKGEGVAYELKHTNPIVLGWDVSGVVVGRGKDVSLFKIGDEVFGMMSYPGRGGAYATLVAVPEDQFALKPANISHEEAAGAGMAALTAVQALINTGKIYTGQRVLIHTAGYGIGHYAIQIAKSLGVIVVGAAGGQHRDFVLGLGADEYFDYQTNGFDLGQKRFDFVLDTLGGVNINQSLKVINWGGTLVSTQPDPRNEIPELAKYEGVTGISGLVKASGSDMAKIADMLNKGVIKSYIDKIYSFEQMTDAHLQVESGNYNGKIIIRI